MTQQSSDWLDGQLSGISRLKDSSGGNLPKQPSLKVIGGTLVDDPDHLETVLTVTPGGLAPNQTGIALTGGALNSDVAVPPTVTSIRFTGCTPGTLLGGMNINPLPAAGVPFDVEADGSLAFVDSSASSAVGNRIKCGTNGTSVAMPFGQNGGKARFVRTVVSSVSTYNLQSNGVNVDPTFYAKNFGLVNDGVTLNDTQIEAMRLAVIAFKTATGIDPTVVFEGGVYQFANPVGHWTGVAVRFIGQGGAGATTILRFAGVGYFWEADNGQWYEQLAFHATAGPNSSAPARENSIIGVTSGTGGVCRIQTATPHGYATSELVGVYGVNGATGANNDPATLATIAVVDPTHFDMAGTTFGGSFTSQSHLIVSLTGTSTVTIVTAGPHDLVNDQLVYIPPGSLGGYTITGNATYPGIARVTVVDSVTITLYFDQYTPVTGSGTYTGGAGLVNWGGVCLSYSQCALVGLNMQGVGGAIGPQGITVVNCRYGGFKYGISIDNGELIHVKQCSFDFATNSGYGHASQSDNRSHTAASIRVGRFNNTTPGAANRIDIDSCAFAADWIGVLTYDGVTQEIKNANCENRILGLICGNGASSIFYDGFLNDGTTKDVVQVYSDVSAINVFSIHVSRGAASSSVGGLLGTPVNLSGVASAILGVTLEKNVWDGVAGQAPILSYGGDWQSPFFSRGNIMLGGAASIADFPMAGSEDGGSAFGGNVVGHPGDAPAAALDVCLVSYSKKGIIVGEKGGFISRQVGVPSATIDGPSESFAQAYDSGTKTARGRGGVIEQWFTLSAGAGVVNVLPFVPFATRSGGTLSMFVQGSIKQSDGHQASWEIRQQCKVDASGHVTLLGSPSTLWSEDLDGGFTAPTIAVTSNQACAALTQYTGQITNWWVQFTYRITGQA